jgi:hypothetical protein
MIHRRSERRRLAATTSRGGKKAPGTPAMSTIRVTGGMMASASDGSRTCLGSSGVSAAAIVAYLRTPAFRGNRLRRIIAMKALGSPADAGEISQLRHPALGGARVGSRSDPPFDWPGSGEMASGQYPGGLTGCPSRWRHASESGRRAARSADCGRCSPGSCSARPRGWPCRESGGHPDPGRPGSRRDGRQSHEPQTPGSRAGNISAHLGRRARQPGEHIPGRRVTPPCHPERRRWSR